MVECVSAKYSSPRAKCIGNCNQLELIKKAELIGGIYLGGFITMKRMEAASATLGGFNCGLAYGGIGYSWKCKQNFSVVLRYLKMKRC